MEHPAAGAHGTKEPTVSTTESIASPAHPPPRRTKTRTCRDCGGEGYVPVDHDYDWTTGLLTIVGGPCGCCQGTGELVVFVYRGGHA
jgi:DnaJ-class molecular chaperone